MRNVRTSLEARNELPRLELLEGKDGKRYPQGEARGHNANQVRGMRR